MHLIRRVLFLLVAIAMWISTIQISDVIAQTSGVGRDGYTRFLWRATDASIYLWELDPNLNYATSHGYGPYAGWVSVALTAGNNNYTYVLWKYVDGSAMLWLVDPNLNFVASVAYGPIFGWSPQTLSTDTSGTNLRLMWKRTDGAVSVWALDQNLNVLRIADFGPYFGYDPGPPGSAAAKYNGLSRKMPGNASSRGEADKRAAAAMKLHGASRFVPGSQSMQK